MKNIILKLSILIYMSIILSGCAFTNQILVPSTIPADMQQLIKSTKVENVQYTFAENDKAELIKFRRTFGADIFYSELRLNDALRPLITELFQTKFSKISNESKNKVKIILDDVIANTDEPNGLSLNLKIEIDAQGKQSEKTLNYSVALVSDASEFSNIIHSFLMKFIIGIDKFLDNEFDVQ